jgi:tetratricopeptide (TPR) repeat protein
MFIGLSRKSSLVFLKNCLSFLLIGFFFGCTPRAEKLYNSGLDLLSKGKYLEAVDVLEDSATLDSNKQRQAKSWSESARILRLELKDYSKALTLYRKLILEADDALVRLQAQEAISEIYFENLQDYLAALKELLILEPLVTDPQKKEFIKLRIAQCMQLTGSHAAALEFIEATLSSSKYEQQNLLKLKAQIFLTLKNYENALNTNFYLLEMDPVYFKNENLFIAQAMVYEEKQDYKLALEFLNKHKDQIDDKNYLELRIKRLQERIINKPFSRGMRK